MGTQPGGHTGTHPGGQMLVADWGIGGGGGGGGGIGGDA